MTSEGSSNATVVVINPNGLHARPCHALVSLALKYGAELSISYQGRTVNGKSILELMTLNASQGAELTLQAAGEDSETLLVEMAELFADGFGELQH